MSTGGAQCCSWAGAGGRVWFPDEVRIDADDVDRCRAELVPKAGLDQAATAGSAQAVSDAALGNGAFDTSADP